MLEDMPKREKVVDLKHKQRERSGRKRLHRLIFAVGSQRFAIDLFSRVIELAPMSGDKQGVVITLERKGPD